MYIEIFLRILNVIRLYNAIQEVLYDENISFNNDFQLHSILEYIIPKPSYDYFTFIF